MMLSETSISTLPHIDLRSFLKDPQSPESLLEAKKVTQALIEFGCFIVKDPRVTEDSNSEFIDLIERYYDRPQEEVLKDAYPEVGYQVGVTPPEVEEPRCKRDPKCQEIIQKIPIGSRPLESDGPDPKWRFMWRIGEDYQNDNYQLLKQKRVVPNEFPSWESTMNNWGSLLLQTAHSIAEMTALGFDLPKSTFLDMIRKGSQLLSPTGSDLSQFNKEGTVLAGFHYDLSFLTLHGKSRYPGLNIWAKDNTIKIPVTMPEGYVLVQAGKQLEWVTGGIVKAGYHEVIVTEATRKAIERAQQRQPTPSLWRVSSTLFTHIQTDRTMSPLPTLAHHPNFTTDPYPSILAHDYVIQELSGINLFTKHP